MIASFQDLSSTKFSLNGLQYNKSFIAIKVVDQYIKVVSIYDTRLELLPTTRFDQVQVNGVVLEDIDTLINALTDVLFTKSESSGGFVSGGDFTGTFDVSTGKTKKYNNDLFIKKYI